MNIIPGLICEFAVRGQAVRFFVRELADSIQNVHASGNFYELHELAIIERHLTPGGVFLDVGANVGNHAVFVAKFCAQREVIVIEPNPQAYALLRLNLMINKLDLDARHLGLGLSDREQRADALVPVNNLGGAKMVPKEGGSLRLVAGDSLFAGRHIDFIKIDVEGHELETLVGLERTIAASRPKMFIEVDNENRAGFDAWLAQHDYEIRERFQRYAVNENFLVAPRQAPL
jgi:FkbM family methyltransferase